MDSQTRYSPEVRDRTVRLVLEHQGEHDSQWSAEVGSAGTDARYGRRGRRG